MITLGDISTNVPRLGTISANVPRIGTIQKLNPSSEGYLWILHNGTWNDQGIWMDNKTWKDS